MDLQDIQDRTRRQSPEQRNAMLRALRISPIALEGWIDGNREFDEEQLETIEAFVTGNFAYMDGKEGLQLIPRVKQEPLSMPTLPPVVMGTETEFVAGQGPALLASEDAPNSGADLPDRDEMRAIRQRELDAVAEREARERRAASSRPSIPLWGNRQSQAAG